MPSKKQQASRKKKRSELETKAEKKDDEALSDMDGPFREWLKDKDPETKEVIRAALSTHGQAPAVGTAPETPIPYHNPQNAHYLWYQRLLQTPRDQDFCPPTDNTLTTKTTTTSTCPQLCMTPTDRSIKSTPVEKFRPAPTTTSSSSSSSVTSTVQEIPPPPAVAKLLARTTFPSMKAEPKEDSTPYVVSRSFFKSHMHKDATKVEVFNALLNAGPTALPAARKWLTDYILQEEQAGNQVVFLKMALENLC